MAAAAGGEAQVVPVEIAVAAIVAVSAAIEVVVRGRRLRVPVLEFNQQIRIQ